jgi:site-specific DNA-methyltransferase (adenine-specific)
MVKVQLLHGDCLDIVETLPAQSVHAIITDIPYGTTACKWDTIIPFDDLWRVVKHILKPRGAFVTTASQPFTSALVMSNPEAFNCEWIWNKKLAGNGIQAKQKPLKIHENIIVFYGVYNPQKIKGRARWKGGIKDNHGTFGNAESKKVYNDEYYPISILEYSGAGMRTGKTHPTQKPVALYEYLIKTYTNEGETVLDITMGSGTTGVACLNTGRNFIGIEKDAAYFEIAKKRISKNG